MLEAAGSTPMVNSMVIAITPTQHHHAAHIQGSANDYFSTSKISMKQMPLATTNNVRAKAAFTPHNFYWRKLPMIGLFPYQFTFTRLHLLVRWRIACGKPTMKEEDINDPAVHNSK